VRLRGTFPCDCATLFHAIARRVSARCNSDQSSGCEHSFWQTLFRPMFFAVTVLFDDFFKI
jgi:hypothetical protein